MSKREHIASLVKLRETADYEEFKNVILREETVSDNLPGIHTRIEAWGKSVGIGVPKKEEDTENLSPVDKLLKRFFTTRTMELSAARDRADQIKLILDILAVCGILPEMEINPHKFIVSRRIKIDTFGEIPPWSAVIPIGNSNSHDYKIGVVAIKAPFLSPKRFINSANGAYGNSMTDAIEELAIPDFEAFKEALIRTMYYNSDVLITFFQDYL